VEFVEARDALRIANPPENWRGLDPSIPPTTDGRTSGTGGADGVKLGEFLSSLKQYNYRCGASGGFFYPSTDPGDSSNPKEKNKP